MKPGMIVVLLGAPSGFAAALGALPEGVTLRRGMKGTADLVIWFVRSGGELRSGIRQVAAFAGTAHVWIAWRKKAALGRDGQGSVDALDEQGVRTVGLGTDLVDFKVCAMDAEWSGLLFARRRHQCPSGIGISAPRASASVPLGHRPATGPPPTLAIGRRAG